jgi:hypothetical protein
MNIEENIFSSEEQGDENRFSDDAVKGEIAKFEASARMRARLEWLKDNVVPLPKEEEIKILKKFLNEGKAEDFSDMPEVTLESHKEAYLEDGDERFKPTGEMSDEEVAKEVERREALLSEYGDTNDFEEAYKIVLAEHGKKEEDVGEEEIEDFCAEAERLVKKKLDERQLKKARKEIEELTR